MARQVDLIGARRPVRPWRRLAVAPGQSRRSAPAFFAVLRLRVLQEIVEAAEEQAGRARLFHPVWLGTGIAVYFALRVETPGYLLALPPALAFAALAFWCARREARRRRAMNEARGGPEQSTEHWPVFLGRRAALLAPTALAIACLGFFIADWRTEARSGARLESQAFGVGFHGRVLAAEQRGENGARVTLGPVRLERSKRAWEQDPLPEPERIRLTLRNTAPARSRQLA